MIISQEAGVSKPDPAIFTLALEGLDPSEVLMIGDGIGSDVKGANNAGVDICWFNPKGKPGREDIVPHYEIRSLEELKKLL